MKRLTHLSLLMVLFTSMLGAALAQETEFPETPATPKTPEVGGAPVRPPSPGGLGIKLDRPGDREFVRDLANLIDEADEAAIKKLCDKLLTETATPIIVVTIDSIAEHAGANLRIETFATLLFDQWGIGHAKVNNQIWNTGILVIVSKKDRKARIELGGGWKREKDELTQQIMDEQMIPQFKAGAYSKGLLAAVTALDAMARSKPLPAAEKPPTPPWHYALMAGAVVLAIFTAVSLARRGSGGWAWIMWGAVFTIVGVVLYQMITSSGKSSGGGFGGGSFGGGSSGGGGASGSW